MLESGQRLPRADLGKDESKTPQNDISKRRAQILKAQRFVKMIYVNDQGLISTPRTHRRRTQNYIQELEKEVLRLRAREAEMQKELQSNPSLCPSRSHSNGLPSPSLSTVSAPQLSPKDHSITVDLTGYAQVEPEFSCTINAALEPTPRYSPPTIDVTARLSDIGIKDAGTCTGAVCGMDAQAAINFILEYVSSYSFSRI